MTTVTMPVGFIKAEFFGRDGAGQVSVPGLKVGDAVLVTSKENHAPLLPNQTPEFETFITVDDEIHQYNGGNWATSEYTLILLRGI